MTNKDTSVPTALFSDANPQYQLLRSAQQRNERVIQEMNAIISQSDDNDVSHSMSLELEALDTIQNTLSTALNVCDYSLEQSHHNSADNRTAQMMDSNFYAQQQIPSNHFQHDTHQEKTAAHEEKEQFPPQPLTHQEILLEEKRQLLRQWQMEEKKLLLDEEVNAIENQLKEKIRRQEDEQLQKELYEKRMEQLTIIEELREHELQRLAAERERKLAEQERAHRKKDRAEQKLINSRITDFLEHQEEKLRQLKIAAAHGPVQVQDQDQDMEWRDQQDRGSALLSPVLEEDESEPSFLRPHMPDHPRTNRVSPRDFVSKHNHNHNDNRGNTKSKISSRVVDRDQDSQMVTSVRGAYLNSDDAERRRERNEFYRVQNEERDRLKQQDLRDIQERLNPSLFNPRGKGTGRSKQHSHDREGAKTRKKTVQPSTDYSSMLSRNRKVSFSCKQFCSFVSPDTMQHRSDICITLLFLTLPCILIQVRQQVSNGKIPKKSMHPRRVQVKDRDSAVVRRSNRRAAEEYSQEEPTHQPPDPHQHSHTQHVPPMSSKADPYNLFLLPKQPSQGIPSSQSSQHQQQQPPHQQRQGRHQPPPRHQSHQSPLVLSQPDPFNLFSLNIQQNVPQDSPSGHPHQQLLQQLQHQLQLQELQQQQQQQQQPEYDPVVAFQQAQQQLKMVEQRLMHTDRLSSFQIPLMESSHREGEGGVMSHQRQADLSQYQSQQDHLLPNIYDKPSVGNPAFQKLLHEREQPPNTEDELENLQTANERLQQSSDDTMTNMENTLKQIGEMQGKSSDETRISSCHTSPQSMGKEVLQPTPSPCSNVISPSASNFDEECSLSTPSIQVPPQTVPNSTSNLEEEDMLEDVSRSSQAGDHDRVSEENKLLSAEISSGARGDSSKTDDTLG